MIVGCFTSIRRWSPTTYDSPSSDYRVEITSSLGRALYQRKKGRDLFDLWAVLDRGLVNPDRVVECFLAYLDSQGLRVSRAEYEANLVGKMADRGFAQDIQPLLAPGSSFDSADAFGLVMGILVSKLPGDPWRGADGESVASLQPPPPPPPLTG
jgi:hypothetical protein